MRVYVAAIIGMIEVRLHYDQIAGAIEILQVPLHFYLYCHISPIPEGRKGPLGQLTTHVLYQPVIYYPHQRKLIYDFITLQLTAHSLVLGLQLR